MYSEDFLDLEAAQQQPLDRFAAAALIGLLSACKSAVPGDLARLSFSIAESMMRERSLRAFESLARETRKG